MCKNMGQPDFDPTLKRPNMGHRATHLGRPVFLPEPI